MMFFQGAEEQDPSPPLRLTHQQRLPITDRSNDLVLQPMAQIPLHHQSLPLAHSG